MQKLSGKLRPLKRFCLARLAQRPFIAAKLGEVKSNQSKDLYAANVQKCKKYIKNGDVFQIVYSQKFTADYDQDLFNAYRILRTTNPSQYMVLMKNDDVEIAGSSPETLVKVNGHEITTMPLQVQDQEGRQKNWTRHWKKNFWLMPKK